MNRSIFHVLLQEGQQLLGTRRHGAGYNKQASTRQSLLPPLCTLTTPTNCTACCTIICNAMHMSSVSYSTVKCTHVLQIIIVSLLHTRVPPTCPQLHKVSSAFAASPYIGSRHSWFVSMSALHSPPCTEHHHDVWPSLLTLACVSTVCLLPTTNLNLVGMATSPSKASSSLRLSPSGAFTWYLCSRVEGT